MMTLEEIVAELDRISDWGEHGTANGGEVAEAVAELAEKIRPPEKKFSQVPCMSLDAHNEHIWARRGEERSLYCPGRE